MFVLTLFSLFCSCWVISTALSLSSSLIISSVLSIMLLSLSIEFLFLLCYSILKFPLDFSLCLLFLYWDFSFFFFIFPFVSSVFVFAHWIIDILVVLKSLSNNPNICFIWVLVSVDWLFSFSKKIFWREKFIFYVKSEKKKF